MSDGPKVFLDYDQAALDRAYDQTAWASNMQEVLQRRAANSAAVRARVTPQRFNYGATPVEYLDVYPTARPSAPIMVFLHGGAWRGGDATAQAYAAETFTKAGAHWVVPEFGVVMDVGLPAMVAQVRRAVAWVAANAGRFGGDAKRIYVAGHSSGGHLAGSVLVTDWAHDFELSPTLVKGGLCISGMYDLKAVRLSARASYVKFDDGTEQALSPQRHLDRLTCPVVVAYAEHDSPEFQRQSREFAEALRAIGRLHGLVVGEELNHFELPEALADPSSALGQSALTLLGLGKGAPA